MLYAILCYDSEDVVGSWTKEEDDAVMAKLAVVQQKLADQGLTVAGDTPEHFRGYIGAETKKWAKVIKDAGITVMK